MFTQQVPWDESLGWFEACTIRKNYASSQAWSLIPLIPKLLGGKGKQICVSSRTVCSTEQALG